MKYPSRLRHKIRGFTLVELIMTIVVMAIVAIPLALLVSQHIESVFTSRDLTLATNLARFEMENVSNMNYTNITNASFSNYQGYDYDLNRNAVYVYGSNLTPNSLKRITVSVSRHGEVSAIVTLITYLAGNITYGL